MSLLAEDRTSQGQGQDPSRRSGLAEILWVLLKPELSGMESPRLKAKEGVRLDFAKNEDVKPVTHSTPPFSLVCIWNFLIHGSAGADPGVGPGSCISRSSQEVS